MTRCRSCGNPVTKFFSLGRIPPVNAFLRKEDFRHEKNYDVSVGFCRTCYLVQLMETVDPVVLFRNYVYFSSTTQSIIDHSQKTARYLMKRFHLGSLHTVLEIGSNDGVHLRFYKERGIHVLGIDPAKNIAAVANKNGIPTKAAFFNKFFAAQLTKKDHTYADILYGANVFAHIPAITDCVQGVAIILKPKGTAIFESPYIGGLWENKFDTIYHEHVFYYSLLALQNLFKRFGLVIYDCEFISMQGGSLRVFVCHDGVYPISARVKRLAARERRQKLYELSAYRRIRTNVEKLRQNLVDLLKDLHRKKKRIAAYGAPAKGMILLNYFRLKPYIDFIVDKSSAKQGLYTPGTHFLVHPPSKIMEEHPDYLLILPWNIADEVITSLTSYRASGGKFIVPIPSVRVI